MRRVEISRIPASPVVPAPRNKLIKESFDQIIGVMRQENRAGVFALRRLGKKLITRDAARGFD